VEVERWTRSEKEKEREREREKECWKVESSVLGWPDGAVGGVLEEVFEQPANRD